MSNNIAIRNNTMLNYEELGKTLSPTDNFEKLGKDMVSMAIEEVTGIGSKYALPVLTALRKHLDTGSELAASLVTKPAKKHDVHQWDLIAIHKLFGIRGKHSMRAMDRAKPSFQDQEPTEWMQLIKIAAATGISDTTIYRRAMSGDCDTKMVGSCRFVRLHNGWDGNPSCDR